MFKFLLVQIFALPTMAELAFTTTEDPLRVKKEMVRQDWKKLRGPSLLHDATTRNLPYEPLQKDLGRLTLRFKDSVQGFQMGKAQDKDRIKSTSSELRDAVITLIDNQNTNDDGTIMYDEDDFKKVYEQIERLIVELDIGHIVKD